jgi:hypothetical protein
VSSRRNASVVVALGVASLAAMVATSELLVASFAQPVAEQPDPPVPDLGVPGVIQVEPPGRGRATPPPAGPVIPSPSRSHAAVPPPRRRAGAPRRREAPPGPGRWGRGRAAAPRWAGTGGGSHAGRRPSERPRYRAARAPVPPTIRLAGAAAASATRPARGPAAFRARAFVAAATPEALGRPPAPPGQVGPDPWPPAPPAPSGGSRRRARRWVALPRPPPPRRGQAPAGQGRAPSEWGWAPLGRGQGAVGSRRASAGCGRRALGQQRARNRAGRPTAERREVAGRAVGDHPLAGNILGMGRFVGAGFTTERAEHHVVWSLALAAEAGFDASRGAGPGASLTVVRVAGDLELQMPPGSRVRESGFSLLGDRRIEVNPRRRPRDPDQGLRALLRPEDHRPPGPLMPRGRDR